MLPLIEHLVKAFKTHGAAINFDIGLVNAHVPNLVRCVFVRNSNKATAR